MNLSTDVMYNASVEKNAEFPGTFWMAVKTTGIFCLPTCSAKKPKRENVEFFQSAKEALDHGYRPCKICKPLENFGEASKDITILIKELSEFPELKIKDADLVARGLEPGKIKRWFLKIYGLTFQEFQRQLYLNTAFKKLQQGENVIEKAYDSGFKSLSGFNDSFKKLFGVSPVNSGSRNILDLKRIPTPLGPMYAAATKNGICMLEFCDRNMLEKEFKDLAAEHNAIIVIGNNPHIDLLEIELASYFNGDLQNFTVKLAPVGTAFQKSVWQVLRKIPFGEIWTYKKQAEFLGNVNKVRAVANANGLNKISIIIPCHRVIGSNGTLTGYGGGVWRKKKLLEMEKAVLRK